MQARNQGLDIAVGSYLAAAYVAWVQLGDGHEACPEEDTEQGPEWQAQRGWPFSMAREQGGPMPPSLDEQ